MAHTIRIWGSRIFALCVILITISLSLVQPPTALLRDMSVGYHPEAMLSSSLTAARLLPFVPPIQVAWAEGDVSTQERKLIVDLARSRGILEGTPADLELARWLATRPSDAMFVKQKPIPPESAIFCLAQNLYFEASTEPYPGLEAVAATVFNRVGLKYYPPSICAVVYQPLQYSWTRNTNKWNKTPPRAFIVLAQELLQKRGILQKEYPVTHFHRVDIYPKWARNLTHVMTVGKHKFYGM